MWIYDCPKMKNPGKIKSWNCIRSPGDTVETEKRQVYWLSSSKSNNKRLGRQGGIGKGNKKNGQWCERKTKWVVVSWEPWFSDCKCECLFWSSEILLFNIGYTSCHNLFFWEDKFRMPHILIPSCRNKESFWPWKD